MIYISAQPYDDYFVWQIEVQIVNFRKFGVSDKMQVLVWYPMGVSLKLWVELNHKYPEVSFFFYKDKGVNLGLYIPQLRPHILAQHFDRYPELSQKTLFYHDSDIIFNYLPDFQALIEGDINWQSNTTTYLDYDYLYRKEQQGNIPEHEAISVMCNIGNISIDTMKSYTGRTGGAQYVLKNIDGDFWRDVEKQVLEIRTAFSYHIPNSINAKYFKNESEGFQSWCADMWAVNMSLWSRGKISDTTPLLEFSWATDNAEAYHNRPIFHNAGANGTQTNIFYKGKWIKESPIGVEHPEDPSTASYYYIQAIKEVK